jgi:hypothetical protein
MVTIGNTTVPGVETKVTSARAVGVDVSSPGEVGFVGEAAPEGDADPNTVYRITTSNGVESLFGSDSPLGVICNDALREGAFPVYAVAASPRTITGENTVDGEAVGQLSEAKTGTEDEFPASEMPSNYAFTAIGEPEIVYDDVSTLDVAADDVKVNPVSGEYLIGGDNTSTNTVEYTVFDFEAAIDQLAAERGASMDFIAPWTEKQDVLDYCEATADELETRYEFCIVLAGADENIPDTDLYENPFDNSRVQLIYPARSEFGESIIGAYAGLRSRIGMSKSPMKKQLSSQRVLYERLDEVDIERLVGERVNPISSRTTGARIVDDLTTAADDNVEERQMQQGISRLVVDYVTLIVQRNADAFIGELHTISARNTLQGVIESELKELLGANIILAYTVSVEKIDAMTAKVNVGIETVKPLRNIVANITAGEVN